MAARETTDDNDEAEEPSPLDHHRGTREEVVPLGRRKRDLEEDAPAGE